MGFFNRKTKRLEEQKELFNAVSEKFTPILSILKRGHFSHCEKNETIAQFLTQYYSLLYSETFRIHAPELACPWYEREIFLQRYGNLTIVEMNGKLYSLPATPVTYDLYGQYETVRLLTTSPYTKTPEYTKLLQTTFTVGKNAAVIYDVPL